MKPEEQKLSTSLLNSNMKACFLELRPIHQKMLDGEITPKQYEAEKERILAKVK